MIGCGNCINHNVTADNNSHKVGSLYITIFAAFGATMLLLTSSSLDMGSMISPTAVRTRGRVSRLEALRGMKVSPIGIRMFASTAATELNGNGTVDI